MPKKVVPKSDISTPEDQLAERDENFMRVYANNVNLNISQWDVGVVFGEITGIKSGKAVILEKVKVNMSKELAKVFALILGAHLTNYEEKFGEIKIPGIEAEEVKAGINKVGEKVTMVLSEVAT